MKCPCKARSEWSWICVWGIDCVSVSVILWLGFGTVLTMLCVVCHVIAAFDHWILTITLSKMLCTTNGARSFHPSGSHYLLPIFCFLRWFTLIIVFILQFFNAWSRDCLSLLIYEPFCHFLIHKTNSDLYIKIDSKYMAVFNSILYILILLNQYSQFRWW